jgi:hypothetical protein
MGTTATGDAGTVSPEPSLGFNPYTTTRPRAPALTLGFYQSVTEGQPLGEAAIAAASAAISGKKLGSQTDTPAAMTSPAATTNDFSGGWYGSHLTGGRP